LLQIAEAKAVCAACPVRIDCLGYALETGQDAGVWGGTSEKERREIRSGGAAAGTMAPHPKR
jgi:WhiB family redox-sensing transcriptional regulator